MQKQINDYTGKFLSQFICGYTKGFSIQHALLSFIERRRLCPDNQGFAGALLMGLSKSFDIINHEQLLVKLHPHGFSNETLEVLLSYL